MTSAVLVDATRRREFRDRVAHHLVEMAAMASVSQSNGHIADIFDGKVAPDPHIVLMSVEDTRPLRVAAAEYARRSESHACLFAKSSWAASRPWLAVEPDPPSP